MADIRICNTLTRVASLVIFSRGKMSTRTSRLKRVADAFEKLGVAGLAIGFYQDAMNSAFWLGIIFLSASIILATGGKQ